MIHDQRIESPPPLERPLNRLLRDAEIRQVACEDLDSVGAVLVDERGEGRRRAGDEEQGVGGGEEGVGGGEADAWGRVRLG